MPSMYPKGITGSISKRHITHNEVEPELKLKRSKFISPSRGLKIDGYGLIHFSTEGYNLLAELLKQKSKEKELEKLIREIQKENKT